jgi:uncharacterized membrane protein YiaA
MVRRKNAAQIAMIAVGMMFIGAYFFPLGYAELFRVMQLHYFDGNYDTTTWFFYAWTSLMFIVGYLLYNAGSWNRLRSNLKKALR